MSAPETPSTLFEREGALGAWRRLRASGVRHVTVIGPPGVGKRTFVRLLATFDDAQDVTVVASTHPVGVPGEHLLELAPLSTPADGATWPEIAGAPAVQCFMRLAAAVDPTLEFDARNTPALLTICRAVDGLPGAFEALAGRLRVLTLTQLAERLQLGGALSAKGPLAALAPDWLDAVRQLSPAGQAALHSLASLADAVLPDTAEALLSSAAPLDVLAELRDASLLVRDGERLRLLNLAKAAAQLLEGAPDATVEARRVAIHLAELCRERVALYTRSADPTALRWMRAEQRNLMAAWNVLVTPAGGCALDAEESVWLLTNAIVVVDSRYDRQEPWRTLTRVLRFAEAPGRLERAPLLSLVWLARRFYDLRDLERLERVVTIAQGRAPQDPGVAWTRACIEAARLNVEGLASFARAAVAAARASDELLWEARSWAFCVVAATARGDWRDARTSGENGLRCAEAIGSEAGLCLMLPNLVFVCARLGERRDARAHAERALHLAERCSDRHAFATTLANLAFAEMDWDELDEAEALLRRALDLHLHMGRVDYASLTEVSLAQVLARRGDAALVEDHLDRAERRLDATRFDDDRAVIRLKAAGVRADLCESRHDWATALRHLQRAIDALGQEHGIEERLLLLGRVMALGHILGDPAAAHAAAWHSNAIVSRCLNPHLTTAFRVYAALSASEAHWPDSASRLAFLARVPLVGASPTEGGELAYHSSLAVRAALEFIWRHLGTTRRADVVAAALDPAGEAMVVDHDGSRFRPPGGAFVDVSHRPALVRLLKILVDARTAVSARPLSEEALVTELWPGEKMLPAAATNRLQNALSLLRKAGLKDRIASTANGYLLEPSGRVHLLPPDSDVLGRSRVTQHRAG